MQAVKAVGSMKQVSVRQTFLIISYYKVEGKKAEIKIWQVHRHRRVEDCFLPILEALFQFHF